jgi:DNA-binding MarR family transcriptional regulator
MSEAFKNGFLIFDKRWNYDNRFFRLLSSAEFRIMIYLLSSALRTSKRDQRFKRGELVAILYQVNKLLVANVSTRTIAERTGRNRSTVCKALDKFDEIGAVIKINEPIDGASNNIYLLGFEDYNGEIDGKHDYFFVDSIPLFKGEAMPDRYKQYIRDHYRYETLLNPNFSDGQKNIFEMLFGKSLHSLIRSGGLLSQQGGLDKAA